MKGDPRPSQWLADFAKCVREKDYAYAKTMFCKHAKAFGTQISATSGAGLKHYQWEKTWPNTRNFRFTAWHERTHGKWTNVTAKWESFARSKQRKGRATLLLEAQDGRLLCIHSHFSLNPAPEFG